jgi:phage portal protein BeeE
MSAMTFRETLQAHVLVWGNAYAEIETNKAGTVIGLWPLLPDRTHAARKDGERFYDDAAQWQQVRRWPQTGCFTFLVSHSMG